MVAVGLNGERLCANELTFRCRDRRNTLKLVAVSSNRTSVDDDFAPGLALNYQCGLFAKRLPLADHALREASERL
jgi:hypothetical protein